MSAGKADVQLSETADIPRFKVFDDKLYRFDDPLKLCPQITSSRNGNFAERYLDGDCGFQLDVRGTLWPDSLNPEFKEYAFVFQKVSLDGGLGRDAPRASDGKLPVHCGRNSGDQMKSPVPVFPCTVVENLKSPIQRGVIQVRGFSSVVRLYSLKPVPELLREWIGVEGISSEYVRRMADGEFNSIFVGGRLASLLHYRNLINGGIQSSTELVKELSQLKSHVIFGRSIRDGFDGPMCPVAIHANIGRIGFWIDYSLPFSLKGFTVSDGPINALPRIHK
jgi:hypothetical protein